MTIGEFHYLFKLLNSSFFNKKKFRKEFPLYIKTGDDLLQFLYKVKEERGFGQTVRKAVLNWIYTRDPETVKKELCKSYKDFDGLTVLRLFHPRPINEGFSKAFSGIKEYFQENRTCS